MDLTFTSEQEILQDSAVKFAQKGYGFDQYKKSLAGHARPQSWLVLRKRSVKLETLDLLRKARRTLRGQRPQD